VIGFNRQAELRDRLTRLETKLDRLTEQVARLDRVDELRAELEVQRRRFDELTAQSLGVVEQLDALRRGS
jgi:hypothetical protein